MNPVKLLLLTLPLVLTMSVQAADSERKEDREQLKKILFSIEGSLNKQDMDALLEHFDERAVVSFMTTEVAEGKSGILDYYQKMFNDPDAPLSSYNTKATLDGPAVFHGDTMTASGRTNDTFGLSDGSQYTFDTRWIVTAVKKEGQWKVVALDFSVNPFANAVLEELGERLVRYVALAFIAGLILMFLIAWLWRKNAAKQETSAS